MERVYPHPGWFRYHDEPNGGGTTRMYHYECIRCGDDVSDNNVMGSFIDEMYLCECCIRELFFQIFDLYSIPFMEETKGFLKHTSKSLGNRLSVPPKMREKVFKRDGYKCLFCGCADKAKLSVDHIHPFSKGGGDTFLNFQTLCRSCNSKKGAKVNYVPKR